MSRTVVVLRCPLTELWATDEEIAGMADAELIDLCREDLVSLIHEATWEIERPDARAPDARTEQPE